MLCNRQLVDGILCLRPRSVRPAREPPTSPARAAAKTRTALTAQTSAAARAAFAAQAVATARAAAKVEPIGLSNPHSNGSPLMAWGWETANICQSKLSWVLLGFGEWKADKKRQNQQPIARGSLKKIFCYSNCSPELKLYSILVLRGVS